MKKLKSLFLKICCTLKKFLLKNWKTILVGYVLLGIWKAPFRFLFEKLDFLLGFNILCGVYTLLFKKVVANLKEVFHSKFKLLTIFITAVLFLYLAVNYSIF